MTLSIRAALRNGVSQLWSVNGSLFIGLVFLLTAVMEAVLGGLRNQAVLGPFDVLLTFNPVSLSFSASGWLLGVLFVLVLAATLMLTVVMVRSFIEGPADEITATMVNSTASMRERIGTTIRLLTAGLVVFVLVSFGGLLLVVPGLFLLVSFLFYPVFIAYGYGVNDSLRQSWRLASGNRLRLFGLVVVVLLLTTAFEAAAVLFPHGMVGLLLISVGGVYGLAVIVEAYKQLGGGRR